MKNLLFNSKIVRYIYYDWSKTMNFKKIITFISVLGLLSCSFPNMSFADNIKIKYDNRQINYSDTQVQYTINGSKIKSKYPGIIIEQISLASVKEIFVDSKIGLSYKFNKKSKTVELKRDKIKLVLTLDSYTAKVNGQLETVPIVPRLIKFSNNISKVYVPARYVAQKFGLTYDWDSSTGIASMTGKTVEKTNKKSSQKTNNKTVKKTNKETFVYNGKTYDAKGKKVIFNIDNVKLNNAKLPGVYIGKTLMAPVKKIFLSNMSEGSYSYNKATKKITLGLDDNILTMTLGSKTADYNGTQVMLSKAPNDIRLNFSGKNDIYAPIEDICNLFEIDIETDKSVSLLTFPDIDEAEEIIVEKPLETNTKNDKKENDIKEDNKKEEDKTDNTNTAKPSEPFSASNFPFSWKRKGAAVPVSALSAVQSLAGKQNNSSDSSIVDIKSLPASTEGPFDTYLITSTMGFSGITGNLNNNHLLLNLEKITSNNGQVYASNIRTTSSITTVYNAETRTTSVDFSLVAGVIGYDMSLSEDSKILTLKIYKNTIEEINGNYNNGNYTFTFTGLAPLTLQENGSSDSNIDFSIHNIIDMIGSGSYANYANLSGEDISLFTYFNNGIEESRISLSKSSKLKYYTKQTGNSVSLILSKSVLSKVNGAVVQLPDGINEDDIEHEDNYFSNNFTVTLPGDVRSYYNANPVQYDNNKVSNVTVTLNDDGDTVLTFYTTKLYAYRLNFAKNKINIAIDRAKKLYSKVVVIDPGHGGHDPGMLSMNGIYKEKNVVLSIGYTYLRNYLDDDEDLKVYWTRKDDSYPTLKERAAFPSKVDADLFISIHMNSFTTTKPNGTEVYYSTRNNAIQPNGLSSYTMASMFLKNITSTLKMTNRGVKSNIYVVTNMNTVPAVLIEFAFLTNPDDLKKFSKLETHDKSAEILYNTIEEIFDNYPTGR